jgi:ATP-dependent DNA helicase PIF1
LPTVVFVRAPAYTGPTRYSDADGKPLIPIGPTTYQWSSKGQSFTRQQYPISIAYAITVHKSQGLSLDRVVIGLGKADFSRGLSFVSISRAKSYSGLAFSGPVTMQRLTRTVTARNRAKEAAHQADSLRRADLTLPAPSADAIDYLERTYFS